MIKRVPLNSFIYNRWGWRVREARYKSGRQVARFHDKTVGRDRNIREAARILISPKPPHSYGEDIGRLGGESLPKPTQSICVREKLNRAEAHSMPEVGGGCAVSCAMK